MKVRTHTKGGHAGKQSFAVIHTQVPLLIGLGVGEEIATDSPETYLRMSAQKRRPGSTQRRLSA